MKINEISEALELTLVTGDDTKEFNGVYVGDLLSRAMSRVEADNLFVTIMANVNVIAVASLTEAAAVILCEDVRLPDEAIEAANTNGITVLTTPIGAYELCCRIHGLTSGKAQ